MTYSNSFSGEIGEVKKALESDANIPTDVRQGVSTALDSFAATEGQVEGIASVSISGHKDVTASGYLNLTINVKAAS